MTAGGAFGTVRNMHSPAADADLDLPLIRRLAAHRFTKSQLAAIDVVVVVLVIVSLEFVMSRRAPRVSGTGWDTAGWAAYIVAAVVTLFRRRVPRLSLAVVLPIALVTLCLRAGGPVVFFVAMTLYCVAAASSRRVATIVTGLVAGAVLAATITGGGDQVVMAATGGVALVLLGSLAGENTRASRIYAVQQAERATEKPRPPRPNRPSRSAGHWPTSERRSPGTCTTSWPTP
jgi:hypothetical protein